MSEFEQDIQEFTKPIAKLIRMFPDSNRRAEYREERRDYIKRMCRLLNLPEMTYAEYLNRND
jgi:enoyl reductase-like protein